MMVGQGREAWKAGRVRGRGGIVHSRTWSCNFNDWRCRGRGAWKEIGGFFFFFFFYIIYSLLRYKKSHGALAMAKTKPKIQNVLTKETSGTKTLQLGSVPGPGPHAGAKLNQVNQGKPFLYQRTA